MLPKNRRIPRKMFPLLSNGAKSFRSNIFLVKFIKKPDQSASRFCFSVSKKVAKSAVIRNRMRRSGYRLLEKYLPKISSDSMVLFSFRVIPKNDEEITKNIESILIESKLIK